MDAITKLSEIERMEFNINEINAFRDDHGRQTLTNLVNRLMIDEMHNQMRSENYSPKIIERTFLERIDFLPNGDAEIRIKSDYRTESGFDVSEAREKGTSRHKVEPKNEDGALSFLINGRRVYSRGHFVEGITASYIIENVIRQNTGAVQSEFQRIENEWVNQSLAK